MPVRWAIDGANRGDIGLLEPALGAVADAGLPNDIETPHLDRGYDHPAARERLAALGLRDVCIQRRGTKTPDTPQPTRLGPRRIVESTNSWLSNHGQQRRNTHRRKAHRHAALCLATTALTAGKPLNYRDRWSPT